MLARHRDIFFDFFFVQMNVDRFRTPWRLESLGVLWSGLLLALVPWLPLAVSGVVSALQRARRRDPRYLLPLSWAFAVMLTFTVPAQKFVHYSLPAVPAFAILVALLWQDHPDSEAMRWGARATLGVLVMTAVAGVAAARILPVLPALAVSASAVLGCIALVKQRQVLAAGAGLAALAFAMGWLMPAAGFAPWPTTPVPDRPLYTYREAPGLVEFASGRDAKWLKTPEQRDAALASGGIVWMQERDFPGPPWAILAEAPAMRVEIEPADVLQAFQDGSLRPLVGRMVIVGRPQP
jgi:hypothetical protein